VAARWGPPRCQTRLGAWPLRPCPCPPWGSWRPAARRCVGPCPPSRPPRWLGGGRCGAPCLNQTPPTPGPKPWPRATGRWFRGAHANSSRGAHGGPGVGTCQPAGAVGRGPRRLPPCLAPCCCGAYHGSRDAPKGRAACCHAAVDWAPCAGALGGSKPRRGVSERAEPLPSPWPEPGGSGALLLPPPGPASRGSLAGQKGGGSGGGEGVRDGVWAAGAGATTACWLPGFMPPPPSRGMTVLGGPGRPARPEEGGGGSACGAARSCGPGAGAPRRTARG
jgi:hypothetical protein